MNLQSFMVTTYGIISAQIEIPRHWMFHGIKIGILFVSQKRFINILITFQRHFLS